MKPLAAIAIPAPPPGVCPCCYQRHLLALVERAAQAFIALYFDAHPPKMGDYCGQTAEAATASAERLLGSKP